MSFSAILVPARQAIRPISRCAAVQSRSLHASSSVLKKKPVKHNEDEFDDVEESDDLDLFSTISPTSPLPTGTDQTKALARQSIMDSIVSMTKSEPRDMRARSAHTRVGDIRKVFEYAQNGEELEGLGGLLKGWRILGKRITDKTASSLVGRCHKLNRPEIALQLYSDPTQYGLPTISSGQFNKLHQVYVALPSPRPALPPMRPAHRFTPDNALWRIVALQKHFADHPVSTPAEADAETAAGEEEAKTKLTRGKGPGSAVKQNVDSMLRGGLKWNRPLPAGKQAELDAAVAEVVQQGGEWAKSVDRIREAADGLKEGVERLVVGPTA